MAENVKQKFGFGWRDSLAPIVKKVIDSDSDELLRVFNELHEQKLKVHRNIDENPKGTRIKLEAIDPFSFLAATLCRSISYENRLLIFHALEELWNIPTSKDYPKEDDPFPRLPGLAAIFFFPFKYHREENTIQNLWELAKLCYATPPSELKSQDEIKRLFTECLNILYVSSRKLTMGLFWLKPEQFLSLDRNTSRFLTHHGIAEKAGVQIYKSKSWTEYLEICEAATTKLKMTPFEICRHAHAYTYTSDDHQPDPNLEPEEAEAIRLLEDTAPQIIFQGPPGTGKTYWAKKVAKRITEEEIPASEEVVAEGEEADTEKEEIGSYWKLVQFHPSYNYEDFVRGIRMRTTPEGQIIYKTVNQTLGKMAKDAAENPESTYVLIIDEINRANISAVLGELIYALEYRDEAVTTPHPVDGSSKLTLPRNLYIIGTMNTADRTIGHIDYAVRRRFNFVTLLPKAELIQDAKAKRWFEAVDLLMKDPNHRSDDYAYGDVAIGHSYFMKPEQLKDSLKYQIIPILKEYLRDGVLVSEEATKRVAAWEAIISKGAPLGDPSHEPPNKRSAETAPETNDEQSSNATSDAEPPTKDGDK